jgi:hypothetical protein
LPGSFFDLYIFSGGAALGYKKPDKNGAPSENKGKLSLWSKKPYNQKKGIKNKINEITTIQ